MDFSWMAWTWQSALFFCAVAASLVMMTVAGLVWPSRPRRGVLPMVTSRGDRFFMSLLGAAFLHVLWLAFADAPLWWASVASVGFAAWMMRWG